MVIMKCCGSSLATAPLRSGFDSQQRQLGACLDFFLLFVLLHCVIGIDYSCHVVPHFVTWRNVTCHISRYTIYLETGVWHDEMLTANRGLIRPFQYWPHGVPRVTIVTAPS